jgi:non-specific serine/threonine protein kinase
VLGERQPPSNLPAHRPSLIGREEEGTAVRQRLLAAEAGLLTLTGAGGCGKTSLGLAVARDALAEFPHGAWLVELAPLTDPALVLQAIATIFGVRESPEQPLLDSLIAYLQPRRLLLIADNCEHLVDACARLAQALLAACPALRILATSREPLRTMGEVTWRVPSLDAPDPRRLPPAEDLAHYAAVQLFVERAQAVQPRFQLTPHNAAAVGQIVGRLDGLPLAIELAAARVGVLAVEQIAARLDDSVRLLGGGSRTTPNRHQTLRATLEWSHDLLSQPERVLFRRLAAFAGGWDLEAAEAVCPDGEVASEEVLDLLQQLVDKSLVQQAAHAGAAHYRLLEPVRQYAQQQLAASGEARAIGRRHTAFYLSLAEEAASKLRGAEQVGWFNRLARELDNLRTALRWASEANETEQGLRIGGDLWLFWIANGYLSEGRRWLEPLLTQTSSVVATGTRATALTTAAHLNMYQGHLEHALALAEEGLALARVGAEAHRTAVALITLAGVRGYQGDYGSASALFEECLALSKAVGDRWSNSVASLDYGSVVRIQGDCAKASALLEDAVSCFRETGDTWPRGVALALLGCLALEQGDLERASASAAEAARLLRAIGTSWKVPECLEVLAGVVSMQQQPERAARLFGAAEALRELIGAPMNGADRALQGRGVAMARAAFSASAFSAAWAAGRALSADQAIEEALSGRAAHAATSPGPTQAAGPSADLAVGGLTEREREVAVLVARGLSNKQIGQELVISPGTAGVHVGHILAKLSLDNRAQLATWVASRGQHGL